MYVGTKAGGTEWITERKWESKRVDIKKGERKKTENERTKNKKGKRKWKCEGKERKTKNWEWQGETKWIKLRNKRRMRRKIVPRGRKEQ